jgi:tol-pal system protein YbgF
VRRLAVIAGFMLLAAAAVSPACAQSTRARLDDLELRMRQTEETLRGQALVEMSQRLDTLETDLRALRGDLEVLQKDNDDLRKRQQDLTKNFAQRIAELESKMTALQVAPPAPPQLSEATRPATESLAVGESAPLPPAAAPATSTAPSASAKPIATAAESPAAAERPEVLYGRAFDALKASKFPEAITGMRDFLLKHPAHPLADNAQYWLAQTHYVTRDYGQAIEAFAGFIARSPDSPRVPDALLKKGISEFEVGRSANARATLDEVVRRFPQNDAARLAREQLARMR